MRWEGEEFGGVAVVWYLGAGCCGGSSGLPGLGLCALGVHRLLPDGYIEKNSKVSGLGDEKWAF